MAVAEIHDAHRTFIEALDAAKLIRKAGKGPHAGKVVLEGSGGQRPFSDLDAKVLLTTAKNTVAALRSCIKHLEQHPAIKRQPPGRLRLKRLE